MSEVCICPICLDDLPDMTWRGDERTRLLCCGKQMCKACTNLMLLSNRRGSVAAAVEARRSQEHLTITDLADVEEDIKRAIIALKCPLCRSQLPQSEEDRFRFVENNVKNHRDWAWAHYKLGCYYDKGIGCLPDPKQSFIYFEKAANMGNTSEMETITARHEVGNCYILGKGVEKSQAKAIHWYKQSANAGYALSHFSLGQIFSSQGKFTDAFRFFELGAKQGQPQAQCSLAYCYECGEGVQASLQKSIFWNKQAADNENQVAMANYAGNLLQITAMQNAGKVDLVGKSVVPEVLYWARKSMAVGYEEAETLISQIETGMSTLCANCDIILPPSGPRKCSQCKGACYCGRDCQLQHWKRGHKWDCVDSNGIKKSRG